MVISNHKVIHEFTIEPLIVF